MAFSSTYAIRTPRNEFAANTYTDGDQNFGDVAALKTGGFAVAADNLLNFYGQNSQAIGSHIVLGVNIAAIAERPDGGVTALWQNGNGELLLTRFSDAGARIGADVVLGPNPLPLSNYDLAVLNDGTQVLTYIASNGRDVFAERYDTAGTFLSAARVDTISTGLDVQRVEVEALADGGFAVTYWEETDAGTFGEDQDIRSAIFNADGAVRKPDFPVVGAESGDHVYSYSAAAALPDGRIAVAFVNEDYDDGAPAVQVRLLSATGAPVVTWLAAKLEGTAAYFIEPDVAVLENGLIVVSWSRDDGSQLDVYAQIFTASGGTLPGLSQPTLISSASSDVYTNGAELAAAWSGRFTAAWRDANVDGSGTGVAAEVKELVRTSFGTDAAEHFNGDALADNVLCFDGADTVYGGRGRDTVEGDGGNDFVNGGFGNDVLIGGVGADTIDGSFDDDYVLGEEGDDVLYGGEGMDELFGGTENDTIYGGLGADLINGEAGNDSLAGEGGADTLAGGLGDDRYVLADVRQVLINGAFRFVYDTVSEGAGAGADTVFVERTAGSKAPTSYTLGANVEAGVVTGAAAFDIVGNTLDNRLVGNGAGNRLTGLDGLDTLDGGLGADTLEGGRGADTYYVDRLTDVIVEVDQSQPSYVGDTVLATLSWRLGEDLENLQLIGSGLSGVGNELDNRITGNALANRLFGFDGSDVLDGGVGADTMVGGNGYDTYYVDSREDVISESAADTWSDSVYSSVSYTLGEAVEHLTLTGLAVSGVGNGANNTIVGNSSANRLFGFDGADYLSGGGGDDILNGGADGDYMLAGGGRTTMIGGAGGDTLTAWSGLDLISGGADKDTFVFLDRTHSTFAAAGRDVLEDFTRSDGDTISIAFDGNSVASGFQEITYIATNAFTRAGQLRYQAFDGYSLVYVETTGDKVADFSIRVEGVTSFSVNDFMFADATAPL